MNGIRHTTRFWAPCLLLYVFSAGAASGQTATSQLPPNVADRIDNLVHRFLDDREFAALAVGVIDGRRRGTFGYGEFGNGADLQTVDETTLFEIGSITKTFTGILLADSVARGELQVTDAANKHLPDELHLQGSEGDAVTMLHLATHRSGLPVQPPFIAIFAFLKNSADNPYRHYRTSDLVETMQQQVRIELEPGERFQYSNLGVGLLGHALVHRTDSDSYESLVRERILEPLGMNGTAIDLNEVQKSRLAPGHLEKGELVSGWDLASLEGCGALRSCAADMLRFAAANLGDGPDGVTSACREAHRKRVDERESGPEMGLCWLRLHRDEKRVLFHNGGTGGYRSFLTIIPETHQAVVVLSNTAASVDQLGFDLVASLQGEAAMESNEDEKKSLKRLETP